MGKSKNINIREGTLGETKGEKNAQHHSGHGLEPGSSEEGG